MHAVVHIACTPHHRYFIQQLHRPSRYTQTHIQQFIQLVPHTIGISSSNCIDHLDIHRHIYSSSCSLYPTPSRYPHIYTYIVVPITCTPHHRYFIQQLHRQREQNIYFRVEFKEFLGMSFFSPFQPEREFKVYKSCKCSQIICNRVH